MTAETLEYFRQRVGLTRMLEQAAFNAWIQSSGQEPGVRDGLWCEWCVTRSALTRAVDMMRAEEGDRERLAKT